MADDEKRFNNLTQKAERKFEELKKDTKHTFSELKEQVVRGSKTIKDTIDNTKGEKYYAAQIKAQSYIDDAKKVIGAKKTNVAIQSDTKSAARKRIARDIKHDTKAAASEIGNDVKAALKAPGRAVKAIGNKFRKGRSI